MVVVVIVIILLLLFFRWCGEQTRWYLYPPSQSSHSSPFVLLPPSRFVV